MATTPKPRRRKAAPVKPTYDTRAMMAAYLDRRADMELQHGHHLVAERLAHRAAELREGAR